MGVHITDLGDSSRFIKCNWWNWRPLVELIVASGVLSDDDRGIFENGHGGLEEEDSKALATYLREHILPGLSPGERIMLGGQITAGPDDGAFRRDDLTKNYGLRHETPSEFVAFIDDCKGFCVM